MHVAFSARFGEVEAALAALHAIASDKRTAFQARLKHFLRLGLLDDIKAGRGKAAAFDAQHILLFAVALELTQLGAGPESAVAMTKGSLGQLAQGVLDSRVPHPEQLKSAIFCRATVSTLEDLSNWKDSLLGVQCGEAAYATDMLKIVATHPDGAFRISIFSLSALVLQLPGHIRANDDDYAAHFWTRLYEWAEPIAVQHMTDWAAELGQESSVNG